MLRRPLSAWDANAFVFPIEFSRNWLSIFVRSSLIHDSRNENRVNKHAPFAKEEQGGWVIVRVVKKKKKKKKDLT